MCTLMYIHVHTGPRTRVYTHVCAHAGPTNQSRMTVYVGESRRTTVYAGESRDPRHAMPRTATLHHAMQRHATPRHATPRHATLRHATPGRAAPHRAAQCHGCVTHACKHGSPGCGSDVRRPCPHTYSYVSPVHTCPCLYMPLQCRECSISVWQL